MKWTVIAAWAALVLIVGFFAIPQARQAVVDVLSYSQCDTPQKYKIGTIDSRFGLTESAAQENISEATNIWSKAWGKNLFVNSNDAKLTVNFVYDERQALNTKINNLNDEVSLKNAELKTKIDQFKKDSADFERRLNQFADTVKRYNQEGGAPEGEYNNLIKQQEQLKSEAESLNERAKQLNISTQDYNSDVSVLNSDIDQFNDAIAKKPEEGLYDGKTKTISIYFADEKDVLVHTLTHEFGHALGMEHVDDKDAIMYAFTSGSLTPTRGDLKELAYVCRDQPAPLHWILQFDLWLLESLEAISKNFSSAKS